jgi:predicted RNase H-like HicB family nuclease
LGDPKKGNSDQFRKIRRSGRSGIGFDENQGRWQTYPMNYHVTMVESDEGFAVWCEDLPGCCSQGATREEALANIRDAIREYLEAQPEIEARFGAKVTREEVTV